MPALSRTQELREQGSQGDLPGPAAARAFHTGSNVAAKTYSVYSRCNARSGRLIPCSLEVAGLPSRPCLSVSIVAAARPLLWLAVGLGALATLLMLNGFLLFFDLPFG